MIIINKFKHKFIKIPKHWLNILSIINSSDTSVSFQQYFNYKFDMCECLIRVSFSLLKSKTTNVINAVYIYRCTSLENKYEIISNRKKTTFLEQFLIVFLF